MLRKKIQTAVPPLRGVAPTRLLQWRFESHMPASQKSHGSGPEQKRFYSHPRNRHEFVVRAHRVSLGFVGLHRRTMLTNGIRHHQTRWPVSWIRLTHIERLATTVGSKSTPISVAPSSETGPIRFSTRLIKKMCKNHSQNSLREERALYLPQSR
jgi:hypothetical protein